MEIIIDRDTSDQVLHLHMLGKSVPQITKEMNLSLAGMQQTLFGKEDLRADREKLDAMGAWAITWFDEEYPERLRDIDSPPLVLYGRGDPSALSLFSIAVVGTRKATDYGRLCCSRIVRPLVRKGASVISGLARGIDSLGHLACLEEGRPTIAVLACGIDRIYPAENQYLAERIEKRGCIITEQPPGTKPLARNFPVRNRIISGLSHGVLVVEAQSKSGTMITAKYAGIQGREVFAIPGNINQAQSEGTNWLLSTGIKMVLEPKHVIEEIPEWPTVDEVRSEGGKREADLTLPQKSVYDTVCREPMDAEEISEETGLSISETMRALSRLEREGWIRRGVYERYEPASRE